MVRLRRPLAQWGILAVGILAGGALALHGHHEGATKVTLPYIGAPVGAHYGAPVYTVPQVLAGWHQHPDRWVGRTILVRASHNDSCEGPARAPDGTAPFPCVLGGLGVPFTVLYDAPSHTTIPTVRGTVTSDPLAGNSPPGTDYETWDPVWVWRVTLAARHDCGPLGRGQHPCLVGESPYMMP